MPPGFPPTMPPRFPNNAFPQIPPPNLNNQNHDSTDDENDDQIEKNKNIQSKAIKHAVEDAQDGDYGSAIQTLLTAISKIKQSKVAKHERSKVLLSSLQDCLHGIEEKSFGANYRRDSRKEKRRDRDRSRSRSRSRERRDKRRDRSRER